MCASLGFKDKLQNFTVAVGNEIDSCDSLDTKEFMTCAHIAGKLEPSETRLISCNRPVKGRYITICMNRQEALTLCEVEVFGKPVSGSFSLM